MNFSLRLLASGAAVTTMLIAGCSRTPAEERIGANFVSNEDTTVEKRITTDGADYLVLGASRLRQGLAGRRFAGPATDAGRSFLREVASDVRSAGRGTADAAVPAAPTAESSLLVGFPTGLLGEQQVFGGVITKVSDKTSEELGGLKLSDLSPIHVRALVSAAADGTYALTLVGCLRGCGEGAAEVPLVDIPIVAVAPREKLLMLDLSTLGKELNLIEILDPDGEFTKLKTVSSRTVAFDHSASTLVFDVEVHMLPKAPTPAPRTDETVFTTRWYLKLASVFQPSFEPRGAAEGVGFFMTERGRSPRVQRWARPASVGGRPTTVKYFVKNVPPEYRAAFVSAFDRWNVVFKDVIGVPLLAYEIIEKDDPRAALLVPGDIRYNILEWDLDNKAGYGGLGPSIANQHTGELLSANVLIQGPTIVDLYTSWFQASTEIRALRAAGRLAEADERLRQAVEERDAGRADADETPRFELSLGERMAFRIPSQMPAFEDPAGQRNDFELIPEGYTYQTYMNGYFHEMVTHELGHNVGLRHNFRGNLAATGPVTLGNVSSSIMEYMGRPFRHVNDIGAYDVMAIRYGYLGVAPDKLGTFCTDEDVVDAKSPGKSAECSRDDATGDPYAFFEGRFERMLDLLVAPNIVDAPKWTVANMDREVKAATTGLGLYALSADLTGARWTNFFGRPGRPRTPAEVKGFVATSLRAKLCSPQLADAIAAKATPEAKATAAANVEALRALVVKVLEPLKLYTAGELQCAE